MPNAIRSAYGIKFFKKKSRTLRALNRTVETPRLHGDQVWHSCFLIMDYLTQHPLQQKLRVMDVGCGWGLLGIFCATHYQADVMMVDADANVFPYNQSHRQLNEVTASTLHAEFGDLKAEQLSTQDLIVGSDICFWPELTTQLRALIVLALNSGVQRCILADPGRSTFLSLSEFFRTHYNAKLYLRELPGRRRTKGYVLDIRAATYSS